jgi:hypothetical protein
MSMSITSMSWPSSGAMARAMFGYKSDAVHTMSGNGLQGACNGMQANLSGFAQESACCRVKNGSGSSVMSRVQSPNRALR